MLCLSRSGWEGSALGKRSWVSEGVAWSESWRRDVSWEGRLLLLGDREGGGRRSKGVVCERIQRGRGTECLLVHSGVAMATRWRWGVGGVGGYHTLARGSRSRLLLAAVYLRDCRPLVLEDVLVRSCRFPIGEVASAHVLTYRSGDRPLLLHVCKGERSQQLGWLRCRRPLTFVLSGLSTHGALLKLV